MYFPPILAIECQASSTLVRGSTSGLYPLIHFFPFESSIPFICWFPLPSSSFPSFRTTPTPDMSSADGFPYLGQVDPLSLPFSASLWDIRVIISHHMLPVALLAMERAQSQHHLQVRFSVFLWTFPLVFCLESGSHIMYPWVAWNSQCRPE